MTDLPEPVGPQADDALPRRAAPLSAAGLPQRRPVTDPDTDTTGWSLQRGESGATQSGPLPRWIPNSGGGAQPPPRREPAASQSAPLPQRVPTSDDAQPLPRRETAAGQSAPLPQREPAAGQSAPLPQRLPTSDDALPLPRRTTRTRPPGRHRSPHRLSVASDAPALVLAVPGTAAADTAGIGPAVAAIAELSCPGVDIRVGYLDGDDMPVTDCLMPAESESAEPDQFPSVVVPLLLSPSLRIDPAIKRLTAAPAIPAVLAAHLGPHPLVAEALHARLAEAGLARYSRATGLSISTDGRGIVVLADVGDEATSAAAVAAVLLASRLSVPVVPASLGDPASIVTAVDRLTESGAQRPVLAPCLIGPETSVAVLDDLSAALGAPCAPILGAHQAIGQLVAIRYGAALASLSLAG